MVIAIATRITLVTNQHIVIALNPFLLSLPITELAITIATRTFIFAVLSSRLTLRMKSITDFDDNTDVTGYLDFVKWAAWEVW